MASFDLGFEKIADIADENLLGPRDMPAILAQYTDQDERRGVPLLVVLPQTLTTPLAKMFARGPDPNAAKVDPNWTRQMEQGVTKRKTHPDGDPRRIRNVARRSRRFPGRRTLPLSNIGEGDVRIECVERGVFLCRLGEHGERYALEVQDIIANNPDDEYCARLN